MRNPTSLQTVHTAPTDQGRRTWLATPLALEAPSPPRSASAFNEKYTARQQPLNPTKTVDPALVRSHYRSHWTYSLFRQIKTEKRCCQIHFRGPLNEEARAGSGETL